MKKIGALFILFLLLISPVIAQIADNQEESKGGLKETTSKISEFTDPVVEVPVSIPEFLQLPVKIVFGIEDESPVSAVIITLVLWIIFLIIIIDSIRLFSPFSNYVAILTGLIFTFIISATGLLRKFTFFLLGISEYFGDWSAGAMFFWAILLIIIGVIYSRISKHIIETRALQEAEEKGIERGTENLFARKMMKIFGKGE